MSIKKFLLGLTDIRLTKWQVNNACQSPWAS